jgi:hypothetical protein
MGSHVSRAVAATAVVAATGTGAVLFGAGTANAAPLIGTCDSSVSGKPGQPVSVSTTNLLGGNGSIIPLGSVPQSGSNVLSIATENLVSGLPLVGGLVGSLTGQIGSSCDVTANAIGAVTAPVGRILAPANKSGGVLGPVVDTVDRTVNGLLPAAPTAPATPPPAGGSGVAQPPQSPGAPSAPGGGAGVAAPGQRPPAAVAGPAGRLPFDQVPAFGSLGSNFTSVLSPSALYGNLPFVTSGMFQPSGAGFGNQIPGFSPQVDMLDSSGQGQQVQNAGAAEAMDAAESSGSGMDVGLPVLVAVLALSGVTATLVRSWVLRRAA